MKNFPANGILVVQKDTTRNNSLAAVTTAPCRLKIRRTHMIPFPAEEILPMLALMFLRMGVPLMIILMMGTLAQRFQRLQA